MTPRLCAKELYREPPPSQNYLCQKRHQVSVMLRRRLQCCFISDCLQKGGSRLPKLPGHAFQRTQLILVQLPFFSSVLLTTTTRVLVSVAFASCGATSYCSIRAHVSILRSPGVPLLT